LDAGSTAAEIVRQELYPYAKGGPVTYTPPGQRISEGLPWGGAISAGWYQSPLEFFHYLADQGLPETNPVVADREATSSDGRYTFSLRWVIAHMIEETGRPLGHMDLLREQADGTVGEDPGST
jgi:hypothetical protein